jgi:hypothetical protein
MFSMRRLRNGALALVWVLATASCEVGCVSGTNRPPVVSSPIPDQTLTEDDSARIDLASVFRDPDRDTLRYSARSSDSTIVLAAVSDAALVLRATLPGTAEVTVTADDGRGASASHRFRVTVQGFPTLLTASFLPESPLPLPFSASAAEQVWDNVDGVELRDGRIHLKDPFTPRRIKVRGGGETVAIDYQGLAAWEPFDSKALSDPLDAGLRGFQASVALADTASKEVALALRIMGQDGLVVITSPYWLGYEFTTSTDPIPRDPVTRGVVHCYGTNYQGDCQYATWVPDPWDPTNPTHETFFPFGITPRITLESLERTGPKMIAGSTTTCDVTDFYDPVRVKLKLTLSPRLPDRGLGGMRFLGPPGAPFALHVIVAEPQFQEYRGHDDALGFVIESGVPDTNVAFSHWHTVPTVHGYDSFPHLEPDAHYVEEEDAWEFTGEMYWSTPYREIISCVDANGRSTDDRTYRQPYDWTFLVSHGEIVVVLDKEKGLRLMAERYKEILDRQKELLGRKMDALEALRRYKQPVRAAGLDQVAVNALDQVLQGYRDNPVGTVDNLAGKLKDILEAVDDAKLLNPTGSDVLHVLETVERHTKVIETLEQIKTVASAFELFASAPTMSEEELVQKMGQVLEEAGDLAPHIFGQFIEFYGQALAAVGDAIAAIKDNLIQTRYLPLASTLTCDQLVDLAKRLHPGSPDLVARIQKGCEVKKLVDRVRDP